MQTVKFVLFFGAVIPFPLKKKPKTDENPPPKGNSENHDGDFFLFGVRNQLGDHQEKATQENNEEHPAVLTPAVPVAVAFPPAFDCDGGQCRLLIPKESVSVHILEYHDHQEKARVESTQGLPVRVMVLKGCWVPGSLWKEYMLLFSVLGTP